METFDILFLCHEKDRKILEESIKYAQKNISDFRKIFILSREDYFLNEKDIFFIDEKIFPFSKKEVEKYAPKGRAGWYFQQFLKLYFFRIMGNKVLDNLLVVDADTIFLRKTEFFENGVPCYNIDEGFHQPYYSVMERVFGFGKQKDFSGITHHMLFQRKYVEEIFKIGSNNGRREFWRAIMENIDKNTISGFSEYDLYLNYMLKNHPNLIKIRKIRYVNFPFYSPCWIVFFRFLGYHYLSAHDYLISDKFSAPKRLVVEFLTLLGIKRFLKETLLKKRILKQV